MPRRELHRIVDMTGHQSPRPRPRDAKIAGVYVARCNPTCSAHCSIEALAPAHNLRAFGWIWEQYIDPLSRLASSVMAAARLHCRHGYISSTEARRVIRAETTKIETYNEFLDWVCFGGPVVKSGDPVEQEKQLKYASLVANTVMLSNVADLTEVLCATANDRQPVTADLVACISPYLREHIRRFGRFSLDMADLPKPLNPQQQSSTYILTSGRPVSDATHTPFIAEVPPSRME
jgi:hypothetical protein